VVACGSAIAGCPSRDDELEQLVEELEGSAGMKDDAARRWLSLLKKFWLIQVVNPRPSDRLATHLPSAPPGATSIF
jgi:hypothetical protein